MNKFRNKHKHTHTHTKIAKPEALIMVETDSLSFILSCCSIPFYISGLIGNVLVIRIVHKTREMHTPTNYLLASMAVSDVFTIMMIAAHRFVFSQHILDEKFGNLVCKAAVLITAFAIVSSITLTVLAVERYNALLKPLRTGLRLSEDNIKKAIALIWVTSVFVSIPNAFFQEFDRSNRVLSGCVGQRDSNINLAWKIYLIVFDALFLIQSVVMVFCYGSLIRGLYFTNTVCQETETTDGERSSEKKKLVITFLLATLGFLIGYVPCVAFHIVVAFQTNANIDINLYSHLQNAFHFMFSCSLCLNPLIYAFRSAHFREGFKRVLTTCWKLTPQDDDIH